MKAVAHYHCLPITDTNALLDLELPEPPAPQGHDLLIAVQAIAVNPVDTKLRRSRAPEPGQTQILGWDAAGTVLATGPDCRLFRPGDAVFYAGALTRPGSNAEQQLVDERLCGHKPRTLDWTQAAAMPLTFLTAWELLFDRFALAAQAEQKGVLLIVGGAGGVGSAAIQLARTLTSLTVVATASRPETEAWCRQQGAHHVIDHRQPLTTGMQALGIPHADFILSLTQTDQHFAELAELVAPQGKIGLIDDPQTLPDIRLLKRKSVSLHWEFMYTRSLFQTPDMARQHDILQQVSQLADAGQLHSTRHAHLGRITAENLRQAHVLLESGTSIGKIVLEGF